MVPFLELDQVTKVYHGGPLGRRERTVALDRLSLTIPDPDQRPTILTVAGESGSGKSTLANLLLGHTRPTGGQLRYRGTPLRRLGGADRKRFRREVQPVLQDPFAAFNPFYRVDHVLDTPIRRFRLARGARARRRLVEEALDRVGLRPADTLGRFPHQLSGGQRQRIMVARALLCRPKVILADEPVAMVDASLRATILASIQHLHHEYGITVVYITHDLTTAYQISESIVVLYQGTVAEAGAVERVIRDPAHPYTQMLVSSIPLPDPARRWGDGAAILDRPEVGTAGCPFAPRCPHQTDRCTRQRPVRYRVDPDRIAACLLHDDRPVLVEEDIAAAFPASVPPTPGRSS